MSQQPVPEPLKMMFNLMPGKSRMVADPRAEALAVVNKVTSELGLPTDPLNTDVFAYLAGRAIREAREAGIK